MYVNITTTDTDKLSFTIKTRSVNFICSNTDHNSKDYKHTVSLSAVIDKENPKSCKYVWI